MATSSGYVRQPSPHNQRQTVTTHQASGGSASTLGTWVSKLAEQSTQPGGPALQQARQVLENMLDDPDLPNTIRDTALAEYIMLNDDSDLPAFKAFSENLQAQAQAQAQSLTNWSTQFAGLPGQPDAADQLQSRLLDMSEDASLPAGMRNAAMREFVVSLDGYSSERLQGFANQMRTEAAALMMPANSGIVQPNRTSPAASSHLPMPMPTVPDVRNFGAVPVSANGNIAQPFLRPAQQLSAQEVDDLSQPPRDRPMLHPEVSNNVSRMVRHILDNPDLTNGACAEHAVTAGWRTDRAWSAVDLVNQARREIAFGMSQQNRDLLMGRLKEFASVDSPTGFAKSAAHLMKGVPYNPLSFQALAEASNGFRQAGGTVDQISPDALIPHLPAKSAPYAYALLLKPGGYATSGRVSPQPTGTGVAQINFQQAVGDAVQTPTNQPMQAAAQPVSEPVLKRQRVEGEFGVIQHNLQQPLPQATQQLIQQPAIVQPMPSLPVTAVAMPAAVGAVQQPVYSPISPATPIAPTTSAAPSPDFVLIDPTQPA